MSGYEYQYLSHEYRYLRNTESDWAALLSAAVQILCKRVPRPPHQGRSSHAQLVVVVVVDVEAKGALPRLLVNKPRFQATLKMVSTCSYACTSHALYTNMTL